MHFSKGLVLWKVERSNGYDTLYVSHGNLYKEETSHDEKILNYRCLKKNAKSKCPVFLQSHTEAGNDEPTIVQYGIHNHAAPKLHVKMNVKSESGDLLDFVYEKVNGQMLLLGILKKS